MTTSKTIAGLIGPTLVAIAAGMLLNIGSLPTLAEQVSRDPALIFVSGILLFVAGLAIVRVHNRWTNGWPVLVTVLGWLALLGGLARMLFPTGLASIAAGIGQITGAIIAGAIVLLGSAPFSRSRHIDVIEHAQRFDDSRRKIADLELLRGLPGHRAQLLIPIANS
jgi:cytochrome bd-type quinol oxidase subunit 2